MLLIIKKNIPQYLHECHLWYIESTLAYCGRPYLTPGSKGRIRKVFNHEKLYSKKMDGFLSGVAGSTVLLKVNVVQINVIQFRSYKIINHLSMAQSMQRNCWSISQKVFSASSDATILLIDEPSLWKSASSVKMIFLMEFRNICIHFKHQISKDTTFFMIGRFEFWC